MRKITFWVATAALLYPLRCAHAQQIVHVRPVRPINAVTGIEAIVDVGVGGHIDDSSAAFTQAPNPGDHLFWPGVGLQGAIGARFIPAMSVGVHLAYQNYPARDLPLGATAGWANTFALGFYTRLYGGAALRLGRLDPWIGVGVDPYAGVFVGHATLLGDLHQRIDTLAIPVSVGLDVAATRHAALELMGQVSPWIPHEYCSSTPGSRAFACTAQSLATNTYYFVGLGGRFTGP